MGAGEELALQIVEGLVLARRHGQASHESEVRLAAVDDLAHHANLGLDLGDVRQVRHLLARRLVQHRRLLRMLGLLIVLAVEAAEILLAR